MVQGNLSLYHGPAHGINRCMLLHFVPCYDLSGSETQSKEREDEEILLLRSITLWVFFLFLGYMVQKQTIRLYLLLVLPDPLDSSKVVPRSLNFKQRRRRSVSLFGPRSFSFLLSLVLLMLLLFVVISIVDHRINIIWDAFHLCFVNRPPLPFSHHKTTIGV